MANNGIVGMSERIRDEVQEPTVAKTIASMHYSAVTLSQLADQLTNEGLRSLETRQRSFSPVNPIALASAVTSMYAAEATRRHLAVRVSATPEASADLLTDYERLRLLLFHGLGVLVAQFTDGAIAVDVAKNQTEKSLIFKLSAEGSSQAVLEEESLRAEVTGELPEDWQDHSTLVSVGELCREMGGEASIQVGESTLELNLSIPVRLNAGSD